MKFNYQENANKPGIYKIINTHTNRIYIGQAARFERRWYDHKKGLVNGKHQNKFLLNDFNKCKLVLNDTEFLEFHVLEVMEGSTKEERNAREEFWISQYYDKQGSCYNFKQKTEAKERSCFSTTPEKTRKKLSEAGKKNLQNPEHRKHFLEARIGKPGPTTGMKLGPKTKETREKISAANKGTSPANKGKSNIEVYGEHRAREIASKLSIANSGKKHTIETREKISRLNRLRPKQSKETIEKRALKLRGHITSEETKEKISASNKAFYSTTEGKAILSKISTGKQLSQEQKLKLSAANLGTNHPQSKVWQDANLLSPDGILHPVIYCAREFARKHGLDDGCLSRLLSGKAASHKGWIRARN